MSFDQEIGNQLRYRRLLSGMTQQELAQRIKVSSQQLQKYESGFNKISLDRLVAISRALNVNVADWFEDDVAQIVNDEDHLPRRQLLLLVKSFRDITDGRQRDLLCELAKILSKCRSMSANR